jgi:hypothetical protein
VPRSKNLKLGSRNGGGFIKNHFIEKKEEIAQFVFYKDTSILGCVDIGTVARVPLEFLVYLNPLTVGIGRIGPGHFRTVPTKNL